MLLSRTSALIVGVVALLPMLQGGCILCSEEFPELCLERFTDCEGEKGELVGFTVAELDLRKSVVRTREAVVGNLVADAFLHTAKQHCGGALPCPVAAITNGGGIRSQTACGERETIPAGPLYERDIEQMLPFGNGLVVANLTGYDLKLAIEHAVDELGLPGKAGQGGHFLQVSQLQFAVDCAQPAHELDSNLEQILAPGARIVPGSLRLRTDDGASTPVYEEINTDRENYTVYPIAVTDFIAGGNDGYVALVSRDLNERAQCETDPCDGSYINKIAYRVSGDAGEYTDAMALINYVRDKQHVTPYVSNRIDTSSSSSCVASFTD